MAERSTRRPESVLVVVASRQGDVLLLRRARPSGYWQSVTGALAWDEKPAAAARRELAEETGLTGLEPQDCHQHRRFRIDPRFGHAYPARVECNTEHVFRLLLDAPCPVRLQPEEHREYRWLPIEAALERVSSETNRQALVELARDRGWLDRRRGPVSGGG